MPTGCIEGKQGSQSYGRILGGLGFNLRLGCRIAGLGDKVSGLGDQGLGLIRAWVWGLGFRGVGPLECLGSRAFTKLLVSKPYTIKMSYIIQWTWVPYFGLYWGPY